MNYQPCLIYAATKTRPSRHRTIRVDYATPQEAAHHAIDFHSRCRDRAVSKPGVMANGVPSPTHLFGIGTETLE